VYQHFDAQKDYDNTSCAFAEREGQRSSKLKKDHNRRL